MVKTDFRNWIKVLDWWNKNSDTFLSNTQIYHEISFFINHAIQYNELQLFISRTTIPYSIKRQRSEWPTPSSNPFLSLLPLFHSCIFVCPSSSIYSCSCIFSALLLFPCIVSVLWFCYDLVKQALDTKRSNNSYKGLHFLQHY